MRFGQQSSWQGKFKQNLSRAFLIDHNFYVFLRFEPMIWSLKTKSFCEKHLQKHFITFVSFWRHVDVNFRFFSNSLLRQLHKGHKTRFSQHTKMFYWDVWVRYLLYIITGLFFIYFRLFKNTIFTTNKYEKMSIQYTVQGFELMTFETWVSSHNH